MNIEDIKLFPHNQETYDKIQEAWQTSNKVATVQATGTGKTYLIMKCLYNIINESKIVLAPSNYILEQLEKEAGETIPNTLLLTYSKLSYMTDEEINSLNPSLIVLDEFHRCGAEQWGNGVNRLLNQYPSAKLLGTSATNIRFLDNERDMADEIFEGNVVTNLSLAEAIVKKILPMPKYISALYTFEDEVNNLKNKVNNSKNSDESKEELLKEIDLMRNKLDKSKGIPKIFKKHLEKNNNYKFIVFCKDSSHMADMKITLIEWFKKAKISKNIKTYTAYSGYDNTDKEINEFINDNSTDNIKLLFSIDMFNEGIHIKDVTGVILLRPTVSPIIYYQQIGRAIQAGNNNNPLIFDFVNNFDSIGAKNFIEDIKEYIKKKKENESLSEEDKQFIDTLQFMVIDEVQEAKILFEDVEERLISNWEYMYDKLIEYKNKKGDCNVSSRYKENKQLGAWVHAQRSDYKIGKLSNDKIKKLENIGFIWDLMRFKDWKYMYKKLIDYKNKFGNCNVPQSYSEDVSLGKWVNGLRDKYKKEILSKERVEKLEDIGFEWKLKELVSWDFRFNELKKYKDKFGDCNIKKNYENKSLAKWVGTQRRLYVTDKLPKDRIDKLNELGFVWNGKIDNWSNMYEELNKYKNEFGDLNVSSTNEKYKNLNTWIRTQRKFYKNGKLSKDRIKLLEELGFMWTVLEDWNIRYEQLKKYKEVYGDCNVPHNYEDKKLNTWVTTQRQFYKRHKITEERIVALEEIGFIWKVK